MDLEKAVTLLVALGQVVTAVAVLLSSWTTFALVRRIRQERKERQGMANDDEGVLKDAERRRENLKKAQEEYEQLDARVRQRVEEAARAGGR